MMAPGGGYTSHDLHRPPAAHTVPRTHPQPIAAEVVTIPATNRILSVPRVSKLLGFDRQGHESMAKTVKP